jgi:hypothetical protein
MLRKTEFHTQNSPLQRWRVRWREGLGVCYRTGMYRFDVILMVTFAIVTHPFFPSPSRPCFRTEGFDSA